MIRLRTLWQSSRFGCQCVLNDKYYVSRVVSFGGYDISSYRHNSNQTNSTQNALSKRKKIPDGPGLKEFLSKGTTVEEEYYPESVPYLSNQYALLGKNRKVYFDVYGCQMNVSDMDVVWSILRKSGFTKTDDIKAADIVLVVTCAIRESAETKVWNKIEYLKGLKKARLKRKDLPPFKFGILGCMAERLKHKLVEKERAVDLVVGPDSYKDLPRLLALTDNDQTAVNVLLSLDETYADVVPVRLNQDSVTAFVSIMRGCDNMCTYCIVPYTRGRERSRPIYSILEEVRYLSGSGVKEITLLGQNVNSYQDLSEVQNYGRLQALEETHLAKGFKTVYKPKRGGLRFADLLEKVSRVDPEIRIRFTSPHPKDFPDEVLQLIQERPNICRSLHMPAQSGNDNVLERMRRGYTRQAYLDLVDHIREILPDVSLSSDFICGFCSETDSEFEDTLTLMSTVRYNMAYMFPYSLREKTPAHRRYKDDVPNDVKQSRLLAMIQLYRQDVEKLNKEQIGKYQLVLVEGNSKRCDQFLAGRNDGSTKVIFPSVDILESKHSNVTRPIRPGDYVVVLIHSANAQVLKGTPVYHTTLSNFYQQRLE